MATVDIFKERLRRAIATVIAKEGLSQSEAGNRCGISRIHMNHLVKGEGSTSLGRLIEVAEELGLKVELIVKGLAGRKK